MRTSGSQDGLGLAGGTRLLAVLPVEIEPRPLLLAEPARQDLACVIHEVLGGGKRRPDAYAVTACCNNAAPSGA
jgi:hypothetical protein